MQSAWERRFSTTSPSRGTRHDKSVPWSRYRAILLSKSYHSIRPTDNYIKSSAGWFLCEATTTGSKKREGRVAPRESRTHYGRSPTEHPTRTRSCRRKGIISLVYSTSPPWNGLQPKQERVPRCYKTYDMIGRYMTIPPSACVMRCL